MTVEPVQQTKRKPGFRPGVCVKNGKLYAFSQSRIVVMKGWPEMAGWTRTFVNPRWSRFRPSVDVHAGIITAHRTRHQSRPSSLFGRYAVENTDPFDPKTIFNGWVLDILGGEIIPIPPECRDLLTPKFRDALIAEGYSEALNCTTAPSTKFPATASDSDRWTAAWENEKHLVRKYFSNVPWQLRKAIALFPIRISQGSPLPFREDRASSSRHLTLHAVTFSGKWTIDGSSLNSSIRQNQILFGPFQQTTHRP